MSGALTLSRGDTVLLRPSGGRACEDTARGRLQPGALGGTGLASTQAASSSRAHAGSSLLGGRPATLETSVFYRPSILGGQISTAGFWAAPCSKGSPTGA